MLGQPGDLSIFLSSKLCTSCKCSCSCLSFCKSQSNIPGSKKIQKELVTHPIIETWICKLQGLHAKGHHIGPFFLETNPAQHRHKLHGPNDLRHRRNSTKQQSQGLAKENRLKPKITSMLQYFWVMMSGVWSCLLYVNGQDRQDPDRFPRTLARTGINSSCHSNYSWVPATSARIWFWNVCVNMPISSSTDHFPGCQSYCQFPVTSSLT